MNLGNCFGWFFVVLLTSACIPILSVTEDEIDWRFPEISKEACPDLSGKYYTFEDGRYPTGGRLFNWMTRSDFFTPTYGVSMFNYSPVEGVNVEILHPDIKSISMLTSIQQTDLYIEITMFDRAGHAKAQGRIDMKQSQIGCYKGALIMRGLRNKAKAESAVGEIDYTEGEFRKLTDGSLQVQHWFSSRLRSNLTGKATGPLQESYQTRIFPLVRE